MGQEAIIATLLNAMKRKRVAHAYLFSGPRGTGKTTLARLFAKALNCSALGEDGEPCDTCCSCREISSSSSIDVLEIDGASNRSIEDVRKINESIRFVPARDKYKIYLIDEVHMLTKEAFNALLKSLEEPPSHVKFFFATTEPHKIPVTIISRCQRFSLNRLPSSKIEKKLMLIADEMGVRVQSEALSLIASLSEGSLRDAELLLDQALSCFDQELTYEMATELFGTLPQKCFFSFDTALVQSNIAVLLSLAHDLFATGKNLDLFLEELTAHFRIYLLAHLNAASALTDHHRAHLSFYTKERCLDILELLSEEESKIKHSLSPKTALEMLFLRLMRTLHKVSLHDLIARLVMLEERLEKKEGSAPPPSEGSPLKEKSRQETLLQFAAKELGGHLKKSQ